MEFLFISLILLLSAATYRFALRGRILLNPAFFFLASMIISGVGVCALLDYERSDSLLHASLILVSFLAFAFGLLVARSLSPVSARRVAEFWQSPIACRPRQGVVFAYVALGVVSVLVTGFYFYSVGYNLLFEFLKGSRSLIYGQDVAGYRLATYAGERYFAPGYTNQFKNVLLPMSAILLLVLRGEASSKLVRLVALSFAVVAVFGLLGAGQRGPFVTVLFLVALVFLAFNAGGGRLRRIARIVLRPKVLAFLAGAFAILLFVTAGLGRAGEGSGIVMLVGSILERIFVVNQYAAIVAFDYFYTQPVQYGSQWWDGVMGILPSNRGSDLNSYIFSLIRGSSRGNSPPSLLGSVYYNFGSFGVVAVYFLIAFVLHLVYVRMIRGEKTAVRILTFAMLTLLLGRWATGAPIGLINKGLPAVLLFRLVEKVMVGRRRRDSERTRAPHKGLAR